MASIPAETPRTQVPLPPVDAKVTTTACEYCPVACGYKVYTWPVGTEGGPTAGENAFGVVLPGGSSVSRGARKACCGSISPPHVNTVKVAHGLRLGGPASAFDAGSRG